MSYRARGTFGGTVKTAVRCEILSVGEIQSRRVGNVKRCGRRGTGEKIRVVTRRIIQRGNGGNAITWTHLLARRSSIFPQVIAE